MRGDKQKRRGYKFIKNGQETQEGQTERILKIDKEMMHKEDRIQKENKQYEQIEILHRRKN